MENTKSKIINKINLVHFRKFLELDLNIKKNTVIFYGNNATGKTTILEAIYMAGMTKSHKTNNDNEIVSFNKPYAVVNIKGIKNNQIVISKYGKTTKINGIEIKKLSDYIGNLYVIMFSPEDLSLVKGSPIERRKFLDMEIGQVNKGYLIEMNRYRKILKERQELLKSMDLDDDYLPLEIITKELMETAEKIFQYRTDFINEISEIAQKIHYSISNENLSIEYVKKEICIEDYLLKLKSDVISKITSYGPHRDDLFFYINGNKANLCSQGQQRTICLSLKIALYEYIKRHTKQEPVILLDDVLSELDDIRQKKLIGIIKNTQSFITTTNIDVIKNMLSDCQIFMLKENEIKELN